MAGFGSPARGEHEEKARGVFAIAFAEARLKPET
jgi:hypothetical protein